ncbi:hypothetical protein GCM10020256_40860 [Streptomyces thermocoprophilus]
MEPGGEDQLVVGQVFGREAFLPGGEGVDGDGASGVVDGGGLADHDAAVRQDAAQGYDDVARGDVACRGLGEERLVRHVRLGRDDRDLGRALPQLLSEVPLEAQGRVHPDVATADNENARTFLHHPMTHPALLFVHSPGNLCDRAPGMRRVGRNAGVRRRRAGQRGCAGVWGGVQSGCMPPVLRSGALRAERAPSELTASQLCSCVDGV